MRRAALALVATVALGCGEEPAIRVAAAANLSNAFDEMAKAFERREHRHVTLVFGSSGLLGRQIAEGAPYDLFASADVAATAPAIAAHACDRRSRAVYGRGRLAVWWRHGPGIHALTELADPRVRTIALASPEHAPYGRAARQALTKAGLWGRVEDRVVYGEDVRHALSFARSGNADVAFVPVSLARAEREGGSLPVDPALHGPLDQALVACTGGSAPDGGRLFRDFVLSPEGQRILARHGYEPARRERPGDAPP